MKNKLNKLKRIIFQPKALFLLFLLLSMCVTITNVNQPSSVTVGEQMDVTIDVDVAPAEDASYNIVFGVLVPEAWDIASNATVSFTSDNGDGTMRLANGSDPDYKTPITDLAGIGENYGLVEWVVFISDQTVSGANGVNFSGQIQLSMDVGTENIKTQLGYIVGTSGYGITQGETDIRFTPCMEVTGGANPVIDLCGPLPFPVTFQPTEYTYDDIIHVGFDATKGPEGAPTALSGATDVYLCAKAVIDGEAVEACDISDLTKMRSIGTDQWNVSVWPRQLFNAQPSQEITDITFSFKNQNGDVEVKNPDTGEDFQLIPNCAN
ncbi:DUF4961 domain-containing protein [Muricauda ruestringensis]|uniref:DUF4961 domain-containing protein n=1 Tax=Flagellimonas TaxID=444459 RepID=UPI001CD54A15|nr:MULTISPECIES: DUF4961 domain-containing protein [Allomuricauda]MCA0957614.1 DUF4961 domain-containing protein [Allomuricauda ruestringensis]USD24463.1 DUF4961 domain-containing protein [Allomuricauda aquimarina]